MISVAVVATFFQSHHELISMLQRFDATMMGLTVPFLGLVVLIPFAQSVLGERPEESLAIALYGTLLGSVAAVESLMLWHAHRHGLLRYSLRGRVGRIQAIREVLPVVLFFTSAGQGWAGRADEADHHDHRHHDHRHHVGRDRCQLLRPDPARHRCPSRSMAARALRRPLSIAPWTVIAPASSVASPAKSSRSSTALRSTARAPCAPGGTNE